MSPRADEGLRLALALLEQGGLNEEGVEEQAWALVFASGVVVDEDSDPWRPTLAGPHPTAALLVAPGTANYAILRRLQLEQPARIRYTCADLSLVERAKADPVARVAAKLLAEALEARCAPLPEALAACLAGEGKTRRHGPNPAKRSARDRAIVRAIQGLRECKFKVTGGPPGESAFELVARAAAKLGVKPILQERTIQDIWAEGRMKLTKAEKRERAKKRVEAQGKLGRGMQGRGSP